MDLKLFYSPAYVEKHAIDSETLKTTFHFKSGYPFAVYEAEEGKILPATYVGTHLPKELLFLYRDNAKEIGIAKAGHASLLVSRRGELTERAKELAVKMHQNPSPDFFRRLAEENLKTLLPVKTPKRDSKTVEQELQQLISSLA